MVETHGPKSSRPDSQSDVSKTSKPSSEEHQTYSGTASKWGQREINIMAANTGYKLFSMDISAAFLKGVTFEEIAALTGEPLRSVQFEVPPRDAWLVQQLPGMSDFDHQSEVLDLTKALWG